MTQIRTPATAMPPIVLLTSASCDVDTTVVPYAGSMISRPLTRYQLRSPQLLPSMTPTSCLTSAESS
jgi:hypothetical protein